MWGAPKRHRNEFEKISKKSTVNQKTKLRENAPTNSRDTFSEKLTSLLQTSDDFIFQKKKVSNVLEITIPK